MNLRQRALTSILYGSALSGLAILGCQQHAASPSHQSRHAPRGGTELRRNSPCRQSALETGAGGVQGGFVDDKGNARSQFSVHNDVKSEIIPPTAPSESYRAKITVTSRTTYSLRRIPDSEKKNNDQDSKKKSNGQDSGSNPADDAPKTGPNGVEVLDQDLVSTSKGKPLPGGKLDDAVSRLADEESRTYDLAYENGHWALKD